MPDPVAPESQGNSISAPAGPAPTAPDPMATPPSLTGPPGQFAPKAFGSAKDAINNYKMGVLQATADGGMAQQKEFQQAHDAMVGARTNAMGRAASVAGAVGGGAGLQQELQGRIQPGLDIRIGNSDQHQADFKAAAKERDTAFGQYMTEVNAAIPLAQAAAQQRIAQKQAAQKQASLENQYLAAVGTGQQQMQHETQARDQAITAAQPALSKAQSQLDSGNRAISLAQQIQGDIEKSLKKKGISIDESGYHGSRLAMGMVNKPGLLAGGWGKEAKQEIAKWREQQGNISKIKADMDTAQGTLDSTNQSIPKVKQLNEYVQGLTGGGSAALQGKAALSEPTLVSGQQRLAKETAPSDITKIMTLVPGLKVADARALADNPDYQAARQDALAGLKAGIDGRGRVKGTTETPWDHLNRALQSVDSNTRTAIIKEFQSQYRAAGRAKQITAKQEKAKQ